MGVIGFVLAFLRGLFCPPVVFQVGRFYCPVFRLLLSCFCGVV